MSQLQEAVKHLQAAGELTHQKLVVALEAFNSANDADMKPLAEHLFAINSQMSDTLAAINRSVATLTNINRMITLSAI